MKRVLILTTVLSLFVYAKEAQNGEAVFKKYCWGCHHQSAMAFGPPFTQIASKRTPAQIKAYILSPKSMYKTFGYKRSVMTQLHLSRSELDAITRYIVSYKGK